MSTELVRQATLSREIREVMEFTAWLSGSSQALVTWCQLVAKI